MKPEFLTELRVEELDSKTWALTEPLEYYSVVLGRKVIVPSHFITDFASVPRLPFVYWLFGDTARKPAVIHDYLYQTHQCASRKQADLVFLEGMEAIGLSQWRRWDMYLGVRLGGFSSWATGPRRYRKLNRL